MSKFFAGNGTSVIYNYSFYNNCTSPLDNVNFQDAKIVGSLLPLGVVCLMVILGNIMVITAVKVIYIRLPDKSHLMALIGMGAVPLFENMPNGTQNFFKKIMSEILLKSAKIKQQGKIVKRSYNKIEQDIVRWYFSKLVHLQNLPNRCH